MNNQNIEIRSDNRLESLSTEQQAWIVELASDAQRASDLLVPLKEAGIEVSVATLRRFLRRHREAQVIADGKELKAGAMELAGRGNGEVLRKGALEAVRQKLYERALTTESLEGARALYSALVREEEKLKELDLAEQRMALEREKLELQRERLKAEAGRRKVKLESEGEVLQEETEETEKREIRALTEGNKVNEEGEEAGRKKVEVESVSVVGGAQAPLGLGAPGAVEEVEEEGEEWEECVMAIIKMVEAILNRAGSPEQKVMEARLALANQRRALGRTD